jgi:hypothetical protein
MGTISARLPSVVALFIFATVGCGPSGPAMYRVYGTVTFDGKPVERGFINFLSPNHTERAATATITNGQYEAMVLPGKRKVQVLATEDAGPVDPVMGQAPQRSYIPTKYNDETTLEFDVAERDNPKDFELTP